MSTKRIKYIAFYCSEDGQNRQMALSAKAKIDYICDALTSNDYHVEIVSPSWTNNTFGFYKGNEERIEEHITVKTFATFGANSRLFRIIKYLFSLFQLFTYLLVNTRKDEPVIVYHSLMLSLPLKLVKCLKGIKLILEVEEIYHDVQQYSRWFQGTEFSMFKVADRYIFSTELLNKRLNTQDKPRVIVNGTYKVEENRRVKFDDRRIHVVYAGTFDPRKGGVAAALAAEFLPEDYHVHIIGFGTSEQVRQIRETVEYVNNISEATVSYDGLLKGEEYVRFLQRCHIGVCTQSPNEKYNGTSFPSKIFSYMANGLRVLTVRIEAVETSTIGDRVYYYKGQSPKEIADSILDVDLHQPYDSRIIIQRLHEQFVRDLGDFIQVNSFK